MPDIGETTQILGGDISFLAKKEFDGNLITETSSSFSTTGVKITRTIADGTTYYFVKAKVILLDGGDSAYTGDIKIHCQVKFDGVVIDNFAVDGFQEEGAGEGPGWMASGTAVESTVIGKSMIGDGVKNVELQVITIQGTSTDGIVTLMGFETNTGVNPIIA